MKKVLKYIKNPSKIMLYMMNKNLFFWLPDKIFLKIKYRLIFKKRLNLKKPELFNEKLQWLKLYDRNNLYTKMVDKFEAKEYVSKKLGDEYIIPTLGIYKDVDEIEWEKLPRRFVLKTTHSSGDVLIVNDKYKLDIKNEKKKIKNWLKRNYYRPHREWPYKNVEPRIIVERYMENEKNKSLNDYKIFCFNGKVEMILVCSNRNGSFKNTNFYDCEWNLLDLTRANHEKSEETIKKPHNLKEMIRVAQVLSKDIPFIRVDLYEIENKVYFSELTFYPSSGFEGFRPCEWDKLLGEKLILPEKIN